MSNNEISHTDAHSHAESPSKEFMPRLVFWEMTNACNLKCIHCRACPVDQRSPEDLTTDEGKAFIDQIASFAKPALVLSGGEPLVRPDVFEIARYGASKGLRMLLATNGTLVTPEIAQQIAEAGIQRVSVSIDGANPASHDSFRRIPGGLRARMARRRESQGCRRAFSDQHHRFQAQHRRDSGNSGSGDKPGRSRSAHLPARADRLRKGNCGRGNDRPAGIRADTELVLRSLEGCRDRFEGDLRAPLLPHNAPASQGRFHEARG